MTAELVALKDIPKSDAIWKWSDPAVVQRKAYRYLGKKHGTLYRSTKKDKKYMVLDPTTERWVHFGQMGYESYDKHKDNTRRRSYLARASAIRGDWKDNKYSPNNLSIHLLW